MSTNESGATGPESLITYEVHITGRVQGVGYRDFTRRTALRLHVNGWVRNEHDGSVRAALQAREQHVLDAMLTQLKAGPAGARVDSVLKEQLFNTPTFECFEIVS